LAEIEFMSNGIIVAVSSAANPGGSNPSAETPDMAIDGDVSTKWLDFNTQALHLTIADCTSEPDNFRFTTANDGDGRDPVQWTMQNYIDSSLVYAHVQYVDYPTPTSRYTATAWFPFLVPTQQLRIITFIEPFQNDIESLM